MQTIYQYVLEAAIRFPKKTALIVDNKDLTYEELIHKINVLAELILLRGPHRGDRVPVMLGDKEECIVSCLAAMKVGLVVVPVDEGGSITAIHQIMAETQPTVFITTQKDLARHPILLNTLRCEIIFLDDIARQSSQADEWKSHYQLFQDIQKTGNMFDEDLDEINNAIIFPLTGVDAEHRSILFSHNSIIKSVRYVNEAMKIDENSREYIAGSFVNPFGFGRCVSLLFVGGTIIVSSGPPEPQDITMRIFQNRCNRISCLAEVFYTVFGNAEAFSPETAQQVRCIHTNEFSMAVEQKKKILERFSHTRFWIQYGTMEAPCVTVIEYRSKYEKLQTIGRPLEGMEIAIFDEHSKSVGRGRIGEIGVRGELLAKAYWQENHEKALTAANDSWFRTGDIGFFDNYGYLHYLGRKEEVIQRGDTKILTHEVEEKIREVYPDCEVCVIGIPDPAGLLGEIPVLCYRAKNGKTITPSELSETLAKRLERNKIPRIVFRVEDFPRVENKISRNELRNRILEGTEFHQRTKVVSSVNEPIKEM